MKYFTLFILVGCFDALSAQIPNAGFENWELTSGVEHPVGWIVETSPQMPSVLKDIDSWEGEFATRVRAVPQSIGEYGEAKAFVPVDYIPESFHFYVKTGIFAGGVEVKISFYNGEILLSSESWFATDSFADWTYVNVPLEQNEPVLTHAEISVSAQVGDFSPGTAWISIDGMGFGGVTSVDYVVPFRFRLFPNPANDVLALSANESTISDIRFYNIEGREVLFQEGGKQHNEIEIHHLIPGVYFLRAEIVGQHTETITRRFVISR